MGSRLEVAIQSSVVGPSKLLRRTEAFLRSWPRPLARLEPAKFESARQAFAARKRASAVTMDEGDQRASQSLFHTDAPVRIVAWTVGRAQAGDPPKDTMHAAQQPSSSESPISTAQSVDRSPGKQGSRSRSAVCRRTPLRGRRQTERAAQLSESLQPRGVCRD